MLRVFVGRIHGRQCMRHPRMVAQGGHKGRPYDPLGNQVQALVKPSKGRQNQGEFARRNLFFRPAGAKSGLWVGPCSQGSLE
jgi:hypothetical protein